MLDHVVQRAGMGVGRRDRSLPQQFVRDLAAHALRIRQPDEEHHSRFDEARGREGPGVNHLHARFADELRDIDLAPGSPFAYCRPLCS